ncbi:MAG: hypothetical protein DRO99_00090 [Candidatus Aenigmatarchaeota archaeon]|nr:MAG: hypothetical protein DRO99_00090 [Candidatus Aenigmarchaeota archaeon]
MRKVFKGWLFNRIERFGGNEYNHVGCEGEGKSFGDFLAQFVPQIGMRRRVRFIIESSEEPVMINEDKTSNQSERMD